jgi:hypothetical protein
VAFSPCRSITDQRGKRRKEMRLGI